MANDFNIKVKYEGVKSSGKKSPVKRSQGQQSLSAIQKGIARARKGAKDVPSAIKPTQASKEVANSNRKLITSIKNLITSNKNLEKSVSRGIGGGQPLGRAAGAGLKGAGGALGGIGGAMPLGFGVPLAVAGFALAKINQIGNAYIDLASQQKGTAALGGFQRGMGIYTSAEMGGAMAAYARGTGEFATPGMRKSQRILRARQVATGYGIGAEEAFGQAGTFARVGGQGYGITAARGAAGGIQADMQVFLSGIAGTLEEAMTAGIDASSLASDMSKNVTALTKMMPGQSVAAALKISKSFQGIKESVSRGEFGSYQKMLTAKAAQNILFKDLADPEKRREMLEAGEISKKEAKRIAGIEGPITSTALQKAIGPTAMIDLIQATTAKTGNIELQLGVMREIKKRQAPAVRGTIEGKRQAYAVARHQGWVGGREQFRALYDLSGKKIPTREEEEETKERESSIAEREKSIAKIIKAKAPAGILEGWKSNPLNYLKKVMSGKKLEGWEDDPKWINDIIQQVKGMNLTGEEQDILKRLISGEEFKGAKGVKKTSIQRGLGILEGREKRIEALPPGMATKRKIQRERLVLDFGGSFAKTSLSMEKQLIKMADGLGSKVVPAVEGMYDLMKKGGLEKAVKEWLSSLFKEAKSGLVGNLFD